MIVAPMKINMPALHVEQGLGLLRAPHEVGAVLFCESLGRAGSSTPSCVASKDRDQTTHPSKGAVPQRGELSHRFVRVSGLKPSMRMWWSKCPIQTSAFPFLPTPG
jgi:hypothetical protein